jgi:hypothetical protein
MVAWIDKYKQIYPENLNKQFTEDTKLGQALDWISQKNWLTQAAELSDLPAFYKGFTNDLLVSIQSILNENTDLYYPNTNPVSLYYGDNKVPNVNRVIKKLSGTAFDGVYTINETGLRLGIDNFFNIITIPKVVNGQTIQDPILKLFKDAYEIGLAVDGTAIPSLFPTDKIMYGNAQSLIHKENFTWGTGIGDEFKTVNIAFAKHINWDKKFNTNVSRTNFSSSQTKHITINRMGRTVFPGGNDALPRTVYAQLPSTQVSTFVNKNAKGDIGGPEYPWT